MPILTTGAGGNALGAWVTTFSQTLNIDSSGWNGFNMRNVISNSLLSTSGSRVRLTLVAGSAAQCVVDGAYIGHQAGAGDSYDFDGTQVPILVSGSQSFTVNSGTSVVTDEILYALDETKNLITAFHFSATSTVRGRNDATMAVNEYNKSAANETSTADVTGYTQSSNAVRLVSLIEVR